jgi:hypothetical protein
MTFVRRVLVDIARLALLIGVLDGSATVARILVRLPLLGIFLVAAGGRNRRWLVAHGSLLVSKQPSRESAVPGETEELRDIAAAFPVERIRNREGMTSMLYTIAIETSSDTSIVPIERWLAQPEYFPDRIRALSNLWIVESTLAAEQIRNGIEPLLGGRDRLVVIKNAHEVRSRGLSGESGHWLEEHFPDSLTEHT